MLSEQAFGPFTLRSIASADFTYDSAIDRLLAQASETPPLSRLFVTGVCDNTADSRDRYRDTKPGELQGLKILRLGSSINLESRLSVSLAHSLVDTITHWLDRLRWCSDKGPDSPKEYSGSHR